MELLDINVEASISSRRKFSVLSEFSTAEELIEQLYRIKRNLLLKSNKNVSRFTITRKSFMMNEEQVEAMITMLPDEVIYHASNYQIRNFDAVVIFADISGFTDLSEKYQRIENGASKLSMVLNFYLGSMVSEILSLGGDIIKYAGDAFLGVFRADNDHSMQEAIHKAIDTALIIQKNCRNFITEVGVTLNVKIAISAGEVDFSLIGNESTSHFAIIGEPVWAAKELQENIKPGEILVNLKAWFYAHESLYVYEYNREFRYYKILGFKDNLVGVAQRQHEALLNFYEMQKKMDKEIEPSSASITFQEPSYILFSLDSNVHKKENFSLRPSANSRLDSKTVKCLRRFIIPPLLTAIDLSEPIEMLSEMRNVVIVFANFVVPSTSSRELIEILDKIYNTLSGIVSTHEGIVNKVSLFDKDMMFLVIFGLRQFKHECEAQIGLRCAADLHETFKTWPEISIVSIGVTTGICYCGVVGHSLRREYSVISVTVNKAARLMMAYPNLVSCERETLLSSKLDIKNFKILPKKNLKGLSSEVLVYEFKEIHDSTEMFFSNELNLPILGQSEILKVSKQLIATAIRYHNQDFQNISSNALITSCLVIRGGLQEGKSRILKEIYVYCDQKKLKSIFLSLNIRESKTPFSAFRRIIEKALMLQANEKVQEIVKSKLEGLNIDEFLSCLNPILGTNFPNASETIPDYVALMVFKVLCVQIFTEFHAVFIDDLELMDKESFKLLNCFLKCSAVFIYVSLGHQKKLSEEQKKILHQPRIMHLFLETLDLKLQSKLACNCLSADVLSPDLEKFLHDNSNGSPGWIKSCLQSLLSSKKLEIRKMSTEEMIQYKILEDGDQHFPKIEASEQIFQVAFLKEFPQQVDFIPNARNDIDLMTYDSLSSYEQLVCKCASVLGVAFTRSIKRHMLFYIMSSSTDRMIGKALVKLFELRILTCGGKKENDQDEKLKQKKSSELIACNCENIKLFGSCRDLPKYACCAVMKFQREDFCSVVYDSLTEKQRLEYHKKSLFYLHLETKRCDSCENKPFTVLMSQDFNFDFHDGVINKEDTSFAKMIKYFDSVNLPVKKEVKNEFRTKKKFRVQPVLLNFLNYDFHECKCNSILFALYNDMIKHCHGGQNILKLVHTKIQLANICINSNNISKAEMLLRKALDQLGHYNFDDKYPQYLRGRALKLLGLCNMSEPQNALEFFFQTCEIFNVSFPRTFNLLAKLKTQKFIRILKYSVHQKKALNCSKMFNIVTVQISKTMSSMFELFLTLKQFKLAKLAAFWSLYKILKVHSKVCDIATSFSNVLKIIAMTEDAKKFLWIQKAALVQVARSIFVGEVDLDGLTAIAKMYNELMMCQIQGTKILTAIKIGKTAENICYRIQTKSLQTEIVLTLFHLLMSVKCFQDVTSLLQRYSMTMKLKKDLNALIWYHALALDFLLDTTLTIIPYEVCNQFYQDEMTSLIGNDHYEAKARFYVNCWLWNLRHRKLEAGKIWKEKLVNCLEIYSQSSITSTFTTVRIVEALTLHLAFVIEERNMDLIKTVERELKTVTKLLTSLNGSKFSEIRFKLHQLHYEMLKNFTESSLKKLDKLAGEALSNKKYMTLEIIKHTQLLWRGELPLNIEHFWNNHSTEKTALSVDASDRVFPFSLPLPKSEKLE